MRIIIGVLSTLLAWATWRLSHIHLRNRHLSHDEDAVIESTPLQELPALHTTTSAHLLGYELADFPSRRTSSFSTSNTTSCRVKLSCSKWYSSLSKLLLEETSEQDERFAELRGLLANRILNLYKVILKNVIKSICTCDRNSALEFLRNLVKLDDWNGSMGEFNKAEGDVKSAADDYGVRQANSYLKLIFNIHRSTAQNEIMQKLPVADMTAEIESLQSRKDYLLLDSYK
ncbi:hypothetical protein BDZ45DRAFT_754926 [Acephala macrosclerotiorum]|nr:hypothetical protein BDZ45DRAFT_754926 [Acephala macrosclerotiorum]